MNAFGFVQRTIGGRRVAIVAARHRAGRIIATGLAVVTAVSAVQAGTVGAQAAGTVTIEERVTAAVGSFYENPTTDQAPVAAQLFRDLAPEFSFARKLNHTTCLPAPAYDASFRPNGGSSLKAWPVPGQSGCTQTERTDLMPTYVDPRLCDSDTMRIGYWLYFTKDGFSGAGHRHDWEGAVVELKRVGGTVWQRSKVIVSYHRGYHSKAWVDGGLEKTADGAHPVIYAGWAHHAMHFNTGGRADVATTWYNDVRNGFLRLDAGENLVIIPTEPPAAQAVLRSADSFGAANPPLTKQLCSL